VITVGSFFTYGYNQWGTGDRGGESRVGLGNDISAVGGPRAYRDPAVPYGQVHVSRVKVPADMIAIADSSVDGIWDFAIDGPVDPGWVIGFPRGFPGAVHRGGANVLFCDGHVQ
jgi:prepilin-type processing-associated H-X9-DG protein